MLKYNKGFFPVSIVALLFGITFMILPDKKPDNELQPDVLLLEIMDNARFVQVEEVTDMIIKKDPSLQLIDVRSAEEFAKFTLPGAINIPLNKLLEKDSTGVMVWEAYLNQTVKTNVFFSNGTIDANKAWTICRRMQFTNNYVMSGGLNSWFEKIIMATPISTNATNQEVELNRLHNAMKLHFTGSSVRAPEATDNNKAPVKTQKKKSASGGC